MLTTLAVLGLVHGVALGAVLLASRFDTRLVDDHGTPIAAASWHEQVVPRVAKKILR